ncbi:HAMP domain-containing protein [Ideonella sp. 4Y16]|uniref:methyl-accepting chemotaxis protein n=1 Tax=Ideonella alba TaxID=2824118 RepID=UPI001B392359|nr:methyl-accepting chemotaxis protein [Ideonella alba]MBQ0941945.1 HAMP domain-containing protein [Ideonella alba]
MRRFSIRLRMLGAIGVVLGLFALVGVAALVGGRHLSSLSEEFMHHSVAEINNASAMHTHLGEMRLHERNMLIDYEDGVAVLAHREKWQKEAASLRQFLNAMLEGEEDEDNPLARHALAELDAYVKFGESLLVRIQDGAYDNARAADKMFARGKQHIESVDADLAKIDAILQSEVEETRAAFDAQMQRTTLAFLAVLAMAVFVVVPLTLANSASITRPMVQAREVALAIADGDLTRRIDARGHDELADLLRALDQMQGGLGRIVGRVREASESIRMGSGEVASGNADLNQRTEQAASSLQQTASSMEELTGSVRHSADNAQQASGLAQAATGVASHGGEVVAQVVQTMNEINAASHRIADIIGVIDGIAFQTNILALNAAVEAARAGESGRGFAVVAGEVRSLAQRSADAAREIKRLIGASVEQVENGTRLVGEAGTTMQDIVASVQRVNDIIGEISHAAAEQSRGIGQVNAAVTDLDRVTQQNAALVEQSTAAAEHLRGQASTLAEVVGSFRLPA